MLATFTGTFDPGIGVGPATRWETKDTILVNAYEGIADPESYPTAQGQATVRCRVSTATCERVTVPDSARGRWVIPHS